MMQAEASAEPRRSLRLRLLAQVNLATGVRRLGCCAFLPLHSEAWLMVGHSESFFSQVQT
jgi:hypothetical protein